MTTIDERTNEQLLSMLRSHVEMNLREIWSEEAELVVDGDGDYPFRHETAMCWVSVRMSENHPYVQVFAQAATGLEPRRKLLREINQLNAHVCHARIFLAGTILIVAVDLGWPSVDVASLNGAIQVVGGVAADIGPGIAAMFDGSTPFSAESVE